MVANGIQCCWIRPPGSKHFEPGATMSPPRSNFDRLRNASCGKDAQVRPSPKQNSCSWSRILALYGVSWRAARAHWYGGFHGGTPIAGWFIRENPNLKLDDLGVAPFNGNHHTDVDRPHLETVFQFRLSMVILGCREQSAKKRVKFWSFFKGHWATETLSCNFQLRKSGLQAGTCEWHWWAGLAMTGHHVFFFVKIMINIVQLIWRFPEMVVPPSSSMFDGIFHCKAIIWCYLHRVGHLLCSPFSRHFPGDAPLHSRALGTDLSCGIPGGLVELWSAGAFRRPTCNRRMSWVGGCEAFWPYFSVKSGVHSIMGIIFFHIIHNILYTVVPWKRVRISNMDRKSSSKCLCQEI